MRNRIFAISFLFLTISVVAVSFTLVSFFRHERQSLIDEQLQLLASSILASGITTSELEKVGDLVAQALGEDRVLAVVTLYSPKHQILYRNENGFYLFGRDYVPVEPDKLSLSAGRHDLRFVNLRLIPSNQHLQVGIILDEGQFRWALIKSKSAFYVALIFFFLVTVSFFLSRLVTKPLRQLSFYLGRLEKAIQEGRALPEVPKSFGLKGRGDDFSHLAQTVHNLGLSLQQKFAMSQATAAQMAHELKTPLTVIRNLLEKTKTDFDQGSAKNIDKALLEGIEEVEHLNHVISDFLDWSSLQSEVDSPLFAVKVNDSVREVTASLQKIYGNRMEVEELGELMVFAKDQSISQVIRNLLENALKYSPGDTKVSLRISTDKIEVLDHGPGIPENIIQRLGQPFNSGRKQKGIRSTGLGLAWVKTLCDRHGWILAIERKDNRTNISISIPEDKRFASGEKPSF